jgi:formate dehydrogenase gamma subunit
MVALILTCLLILFSGSANLPVNFSLNRSFMESDFDSSPALCSSSSELIFLEPTGSSSDNSSETNCLECHDETLLEEVEKSVHEGFSCRDCHLEIKAVPHEEIKARPDCSQCHEEVVKVHRNSIHGQAIAQGIDEAANCSDCHQKHLILSHEDEQSTISHKNLPITCGRCHSQEDLAEKYKILIRSPYQMYEESVHHQALLEGKNAAVCSDCHGVHDILESWNPGSKISQKNIPQTCSACHLQEYKDYIQSIHWEGYQGGIQESPVCTDCHAEHRILSRINPKSPIYPLNVPKTCSDCHERYVLAERYGISTNRLSSFYSSYHGIALKSGNVVAANCASCHQNHLVLPALNPASPVNPQNLPKTCGSCHPGIKETAAIQSVHEVVSTIGASVIHIVKTVYIWLIIILIGGMVIFCLLDLIKKAKEKSQQKFISPEDEEDILRFTQIERLIHLFHLLSFLVLVYTGFIHHFPEAAWGKWLAQLGGGVVRSFIHRVAGVVMLVTFLIQVGAVALTNRGREQFKALLPRRQDLQDAFQLLLYNLGLKAERPLSGRFTFYEKVEYWALIWGSVIMGFTGLGLWFKTQTLNLVPRWFIDLFLVIHYYEAILASLAILIWHLYWVIFDPVVYPLNKSMFTGKLPKSIYEEEHPLEFKKEIK